MKTRDLENLLSAHADGLNAGRDLADALTAHRPEAAESARPLMSLARRVQEALQPVAPRPGFVAALRAQLVAPPSPAPRRADPAGRRQSLWFWVLAGVGGLISVASAVLIVARLVSGGARLVADFLERRASRVSPAKMPAVH